MEANSIKKKNNNYCCVPQCKSKGSRAPDVSFHKFPSSESVIHRTTFDGLRILVNRRKEWIRLLKIGKDVSKRMTVCSRHFDQTAFTFPPEKCKRPRLKASALPTLNLPKTSTSSEQTALKEAASAKRLARYEEINRKKRMSYASCEMPGTSAEASDSSVDMSETVQISEDNINLTIPAVDMPESVEIFEDDINSANEITVVKNLLSVNSVQKNNKCTQVCSGDLKTQHIIKADELSDRQLNSISGLHSMSLLNYLAKEVAVELKIGNKHHLPVKERILLTMMKMYLKLSFTALSIFFGCTIKTACNIFSSVIPVLSSILGLFIEWPTKDDVIANCPHVFKPFQNVRVVLDCTEILVQKPRCLKERIDLYSHYYKDLTIKFMIAASPGGCITYVSRGYGGKASDQHIFLESKIVEMLEPHIDAVMVDKGFLIEDVCAEKFITVVRPPFLRNKKQFSAGEAKITKKIAAARVHVERVIQRVKLFEIFKGTFPYHLIKLVDHMIIIAAGLANLGSPVLGDDKFPFNVPDDDQFYLDDDHICSDDELISD